MSLHVLANHMATKGRGPDSMLVHMSPQEVASLQALAMKNGGSLTINPETGLPEAGWLSKLLPAIAGFALNAFAPGFGSAIAGALGTSAAVGTAIGVGGITGLATGSLSKGLMAGLGAYGGAGLAEGLATSGVNAMTNAGMANYADTLAAQGLEQGSAAYGEQASKLALESQKEAMGKSLSDKLAAGWDATKADPLAFAKNNWQAGLAAASPMIADAMVPTTTKMPTAQSTGYIRPYDYNPYTQSFTRLTPVKAGFNDGGIVALADGGQADQYARYNNLTGQSKSAYDYLMGNAPSSTAGLPPTQASPTFTSTQVPAKPAAVTNVGGGITDLPPANVIAPTAPVLPYEFSASPTENFTDNIPRISNQDAIDNIEQTVSDEANAQNEYDLSNIYNNQEQDRANQEAVNRVEEAVQDDNFAESARASDIDNATISTDPVYVSDDGTTASIEDLIREMAPPSPTPEKLVNRDEWGNLQSAIEANMNPVQDDGTTEAIQNQILAQENPWGNLDEYIAANNFADSARASDIDAATIGADNAGTYSGFTPAPADRNTPVVDMTPSPSTDMRSALAAGVDPITGMAKDNGAAEEAAREIEAAQREEAQRIHEAMNFNANTQNVVEPSPYVPEPSPYVPEPSPYVPEPSPYVPAEEPREPSYQDIYRPEEQPKYTPAEERQAAIQEYLYGGGGGGGGRTDNMLAEYGGNDFGGDFGDYGNYGENMFAADGGLMGYARGGSTRPFFSKETGKFSFQPPRVYAMGGLGSLGGYSDGGRLLKGPGDGVSDSIPATIGAKGQPARLADGEFVVPARIVSELGNGSTEAGARKLYAMMDRVQKARGKTTGKNKMAANTRSDKYLPA